MARPGSLFVALCMVAIAVSAAALAFVIGQVEAGFAAAIGFAVLLALVIGHFGSERAGERAATEARLAALDRTAGELARDLAEAGRRIDRFEALAREEARAAAAPLQNEIGALGALVRQFAETLQAHEAAIVGAVRPAAAMPAAAPEPPGRAAAGPPPAAPAAMLRQVGEMLRQRVEPQAAAPDLPAVFAGLSRAEAIVIVDEAVAARRYDLYLQPIVVLPQRKVRWYQASVRLRTAEGAALLPADFRALAEAGGLTPSLDAETLGRCIQVVRRLSERNRDVGLVCDIAGASLADGAFATEIIASLEAARGVAGLLMLGFRQEAVRNLSPLDLETLRALADLGFRFSMDGVADLRIEPRDLAEKGFRQVKVPADLMLAPAAATASAIHPSDLGGLFGRYGIDLVVEGVDTETAVVDLLDYDVKLAQGIAFSPPRPVRPDVLQKNEPAAAPPAPRTPRAEPRADPRPAPPQSLGEAVLAAGALGAAREPRRPPVGQGLRALIRDRS